MFGRSSNKKLYVLTGTGRLSLLVELLNPDREQPGLSVLARSETSLLEEVTIPRLLASVGNLRGNTAVVLPLHFFETVPVSLPMMPEGAIGKALPYHLAKVVPKAINEYVYDWQLSERHRDRLQLMVYLYRSRAFEKMRAELARKRLEVKYLEADIFAACALLERGKRLDDDHANLVLLVWLGNISLAVYDKNQLTLVRTVQVEQPTAPRPPVAPPEQPRQPEPSPDLSEDDVLLLDLAEDEPVAEAEAVPAGPGSEPEPELILTLESAAESPEETVPTAEPEPEQEPEMPAAAADAHEEISIGDWGIFMDGGDSAPEKPAISSTPPLSRIAAAGPRKVVAPANDGPGGSTSWEDYFQRVGLEIMRTRDYYTSVIKGRPIRQVFVGGAELFWQDLSAANQSSLGLELQPLTSEQPQLDERITPLLRALVLGAGIR